MSTLEDLLDIAGWRFVEDDGTVWMIGDCVTWEEPIGSEYVTVVGVICGFDFDEEAALVQVITPFTGDTMEVRLAFLTKVD